MKSNLKFWFFNPFGQKCPEGWKFWKIMPKYCNKCSNCSTCENYFQGTFLPDDGWTCCQYFQGLVPHNLFQHFYISCSSQSIWIEFPQGWNNNFFVWDHNIETFLFLDSDIVDSFKPVLIHDRILKFFQRVGNFNEGAARQGFRWNLISSSLNIHL